MIKKNKTHKNNKEDKDYNKKEKVVVILGATATGKTGLGVKLANKYDAEIISADSRQVFKGMDIGSGKDLAEFVVDGKEIKHHLIDVVLPMEDFNISKYQKLAFKAISKVLKKEKLPIIVGGSGLYLQTVIDNYNLAKTATNIKRRNELEKIPKEDLFERIKILKENFALNLNNSDKNNPRRLARYLEILESGESVNQKKESKYDYILLGLEYPDDLMKERIEYRLLQRLEEGMTEEVKNLLDSGVTSKRLKSFGLEYRYITKHLEGEYNYLEMVEKLNTAIYRFSKRQKTWFKRLEKQGKEIHWIKNQKEAEKLIDKFLK
ncbi:MAG: tRNA (adenosine(37)-N6)-dimethylallyltransferase MiaA [Patescibacteria group bacterium]|jgi:tRNA dimethylallyltransferase|nr:tRNA (adenosine(37)-N6)-dimethylallyltransferase MiaA [Patescibacteria group bacterium]